MFAKLPEQTKFVIKQTTKTTGDSTGESKRKVVVLLRVTNGQDTISFETHERFFVKRITSLVHWFTVKMVSLGESQDSASLKDRLAR
jgi:hypothetical protein